MEDESLFDIYNYDFLIVINLLLNYITFLIRDGINQFIIFNKNEWKLFITNDKKINKNFDTYNMTRNKICFVFHNTTMKCGEKQYYSVEFPPNHPLQLIYGTVP